MGTSQKYSLRWNDFSLNVATTFRDLHSQHDFVDVTLACADGSTISAHKVILSSVSTYFRDILKNAPCKHPIIILKDTLKEEAQAMLEFAYTGEVNVGQELLPSLLHTARCYKIKGLDNVQTPPGLLDQNANAEQEWVGSLPPTRPHTPSTRPHTPRTRPSTPSTRPQSPHSNIPPHSPHSVLSAHDSMKPFQSEHMMGRGHSPHPSHLSRAHSSHSHSQPPTRPASPVCNSMPPSPQSNARTPPPKRWKRSFDLARNDDGETEPQQQHGHPGHMATPGHAEFTESVAKRFCEKRYSLETEREKRFHEADSNHSQPERLDRGVTKRFVEPGQSAHAQILTSTYPHSMPASPTMFDARNINSLGILRHFARVGSQDTNGEAPREAHENSRGSDRGDHASHANSHALDYRYQPADQSEMNGHGRGGEESDQQRRQRLTVYRPESAPTLPTVLASNNVSGPLDMSPEASLQGAPSAHDLSTDGMEQDERLNHFRNIVVGTLQPVSSAGDLSDCVSKALNTSGGGGSGRYSCDECGKLFKHPGSLQHHRHIHRGTHKCPSCGKAFSRRWDMERHLNKSKYGCPANRFSGPGAGDRSMSDMSEGDLSNQEGPVSLVSSVSVTNNLPHETAMVTLIPSHINGTSH